MKTDWFELKEARLHLAPYSYPHFPIACASTITPSGMIAAGKHGLGVLSIGAGIPGGPEMLGKQWGIYEETAAKHGHKADRSKWRVVVNCPRRRGRRAGAARGPRGRAPRDHHLFRGHARPPAGPRRRSAARRRQDGHDPGRFARTPLPRASSGCSVSPAAASAACCSAPTNGRRASRPCAPTSCSRVM